MLLLCHSFFPLKSRQNLYSCSVKARMVVKRRTELQYNALVRCFLSETANSQDTSLKDGKSTEIVDKASSSTKSSSLASKRVPRTKPTSPSLQTKSKAGLGDDKNSKQFLSVINQLPSSTNSVNELASQESIEVKCIDPLPRHSGFNKWIMFSDLHVKSSSIETCEEVLRSVNEVAQAKDAGIIFLGDFWHVRGALSVDLLNRILKSLRQWTQPVIMIPGNHDQVTLGGTIHALEPLIYAFDKSNIMLLNEPCILMNALWIPYRRSKDLMKEILSIAWERNDIKAIFCHADVRGAWMNDGIQSREGMDIKLFPPKIPIYSGHFHKPHVVNIQDHSLCYIGSPYQTSLSEADQVKFFYCIGSESTNSVRHWEEIERWPINFGKKYYKVSSYMDKKLQEVRPGDRVVISTTATEQLEADAVSRQLKDRGVEVELRQKQPLLEKSKSSTTVSLLEGNDLNLRENEIEPAQLFDMFMETVNAAYFEDKAKIDGNGTSSESTKITVDALRNAIIEEGKSTIQRLEGFSEKGETKDSREVHDILLDELTLHNFGPYGGPKVRYPLSKRGLVLLRGKTMDNTGADSNGSGKTTLAMSILWCLTGSMDTRIISDGRSFDVAYDAGGSNENVRGKSKSSGRSIAEASLTGLVNDKPFELRRKKSSKKQELFFSIDGKDLTCQAVKDTQAVIDSELGLSSGILQRCYFFGQHSHTSQSLLGLTDARLKEELKPLVNTDIWMACAQDARVRLKKLKSDYQELEITLRFKQSELATLQKSMHVEREGLEAIREEIARKKRDYYAQRQSTPLEEATLEISLEEIELERSRLQKEQIEPLRLQLLDLSSNFNLEKALIRAENDLSSDASRLKTLLEIAVAKLASLRSQLEEPSFAEAQKALLASQIDAKLQPDEVAVVENKLLTAKTLLEDKLAQIGAIDERIKSTNTTLQKLRAAEPSLLQNIPCDAHIRDNCPTCGQLLPSRDRQNRLKEMQIELKELLKTRLDILKEKDSQSAQVSKLEIFISNRNSFIDIKRERSLKEEEILRIAAEQETSQAKLKQVEIQISEKNKKAMEYRSDLENEINNRKEILSRLEAQNRALDGKCADIRKRLSANQKLKESFQRGEVEFNSSIEILTNKLQYSEKAYNGIASRVKNLESDIEISESRRGDLLHKTRLLEELEALFGSRGIQHFAFQNTIKKLESVANSYLDILAEGGIQLQLRGDEDAERILKTVLVRGMSDGDFRERGLAQLSGGQWRRVSLALDFAFSELVMKRGILRLNLLVLDEILTHLDGQGREAVGAVLKTMIDQRSKEKEISDDEFEGEKDNNAYVLPPRQWGYETIIVILQDLVANEIEEAFDQIDVVVKKGDIATVEIDGIY